MLCNVRALATLLLLESRTNHLFKFAHKIIQWNCRGLRSNAEFLKVLINSVNAGVVCLQETKLGVHHFNPGFNYQFYSSPPPISERAKGGTAILISKSLQHSPLNVNTTLQAVAARILMNNKFITVCSLYLPPDLDFNLQNLQDLIDQLPSPFLLLVDFNAHNGLWDHGINNADSKGRIIEDLIDNNPISFFNDGSPTFYNVHTGYSSAIDLSICSSNILLDFYWSVEGDLNGSDHFPICLESIENTPSAASPKWKVEEADWGKFSQEIKLDSDFNSFNNHIEAYDFFMDSILSSGNANIPKTKCNPKRPAVPWWNKTCAVLRKVTRKCFRRYKTSGSSQAKIAYLRNQAKQKRYFKQVKRDSWIYYINGINSQVAPRTVWRKIKKLSGKFVPSPLPSLKINDTLITKPEEVAEKLGEHFAGVSSPSQYSPEFQDIRNTPVILDLGSDNLEEYNAPFTLRELHEALSSTESTSPGEDNIIYEMLKHLPEHAKKFLLKIINKIWETGVLPESWKISVIIPVKKPGKDANQASSYRPIALTSCVCKVVEKMINTRLVWYLETNKCLTNYQYGFRKNHSTLDPLLRLSNHIQQGFANGKQTIGVFFDLEKAYDRTCRKIIIQQFFKMGVRGNMLNFLMEFLTDRFLKVKVGNTLSSPFRQEEGVPQGSVLSVTCFSAAINSIVEAVTDKVHCSLFVDDFAIYATSSDAEEACELLQRSIDSIYKWTKVTGFKFSTSKTTAIRFTRSRKVEPITPLELNGTIIPLQDQVKFLGVIFDKKLTWGPHIDNLKMKVKNSINILKVVSSFDWGADKKSLIKLYNAVCRSKMDYACQIYSSACKTRLKELDVVHNLGLRICSGAYRTSPIESIYVDCNQLPLDLRREELSLRYYHRLNGCSSNPAKRALAQRESHKFKTRSSKPFQVRLEEEVEEEDLLNQEVTPIGFLKVPPWLVPKADCCPKFVSKKNISEEEIHSKFLEHDTIHSHQEKFYTDGSKSEEGVGCAVVCEEFTDQAKFPSSTSIFTAELSAIVQCLEIINVSNKDNFVIHTDSHSAMTSLKQYNPSHPLVQKAQEWLFRLHIKFKKVQFCWVPSHVGIQLNELADQEAKEAACLPNISCNSIPHSDLKAPTKQYINAKWQRRWSSPLLANNLKYKRIRPSVQCWPSSYHPKRRYETILSRLRIGHSRLTHQFLLAGSNPPVCAYCQVTLTVEHILVDCPNYRLQRSRFGLLGKGIEAILGEYVEVENLMNFLKKIDVFYEI